MSFGESVLLTLELYTKVPKALGFPFICPDPGDELIFPALGRSVLNSGIQMLQCAVWCHFMCSGTTEACTLHW